MYKKLTEFKRKVTTNTNKGRDLINDAIAVMDMDHNTVSERNVENLAATLLKKRDDLIAYEEEMNNLLRNDPVMAESEESRANYRREMTEHFALQRTPEVANDLDHHSQLLREFATRVTQRGGQGSAESIRNMQANDEIERIQVEQPEILVEDNEPERRPQQIIQGVGPQQVPPAMEDPRRPNRQRTPSATRKTAQVEDPVLRKKLGEMKQHQEAIGTVVYQLMKKIDNMDANVKSNNKDMFRQLREFMSKGEGYAQTREFSDGARNSSRPQQSQRQEPGPSNQNTGRGNFSGASEASGEEDEDSPTVVNSVRRNNSNRASSSARLSAPAQAQTQSIFGGNQDQNSGHQQRQPIQPLNTPMDQNRPNLPSLMSIPTVNNADTHQNTQRNNMMQHQGVQQHPMQVALPMQNQQMQMNPYNQPQYGSGQYHNTGRYGNSQMNHMAYPYQNNILPPVYNASPQMFGATDQAMQTQMRFEQVKQNAITTALATTPPFSGDETEWPIFIGRFDTYIHFNTFIDVATKQHLLMQLLPKHVAVQHQTLHVTEQSYMMIRNSLDRQFNRPKTQKMLNYNQLEEIVFPEHNLEELTVALNTYSTTAHKLAMFGMNPDDQRSLTRLLCQLPPKIRSAVQRKFEFGAPTLNDLIETAHDAVSNLQCRTLTGSRAPNKGIYTTTINAVNQRESSQFAGRRYTRQQTPRPRISTKDTFTPPSKMKPCRYCEDDGHTARECPLSVKEKQKAVQDRKLCYNCLASDHGVMTCKSRFSCFNCHRRHFTAHCPKIADQNTHTVNIVELYDEEESDSELEQQMLFQYEGAQTPEI